MARLIRSALGAVLAAVVIAASSTTSAQIVHDVFPIEPEDGSVSGPKPVFQIGADGSDLFNLKFRIVLSQDDFDTEAYVFDQRQEDSNWVYTALQDDFGAIYRVRTPLSDGTYDWRADVWNGVDWIEGGTTFRVAIDSVAPAKVEGLEMSVDRGRGGISLEWHAVTIDLDGRPEYVATYHVYRYIRRSLFFVMTPFRIGTTGDTYYLDTEALDLQHDLVFYKVTAEDEAGNETERRY